MVNKKRQRALIKSLLGGNSEELLAKVELYKPTTNTTVDHEEIKTALQIVPKAILALLQKELSPMKEGENKQIVLPIGSDAKVDVTKHAKDVYSGDILNENKQVGTFKYRSLPGVGLVILTAFELYDISILNDKAHSTQASEADIESIVERKLNERDRIEKIVEDKISKRNFVEKLILTQIEQRLFQKPSKELAVTPPSSPSTKDEKKTLKRFLDSVKQKRAFEIKIEKSETISCPDCLQSIFQNNIYSGCVCFGNDMSSKVFVHKAEGKTFVSFSKNWDIENIEMLVDLLHKKTQGDQNG